MGIVYHTAYFKKSVESFSGSVGGPWMSGTRVIVKVVVLCESGMQDTIPSSDIDG